MKTKRRWCLKIFLLSVVFASFNVVKAQDYPRLTDKVTKQSKTTYFDLVRKIFPGARLDESGEATGVTRSIQLRKLFGEEMTQIDSPRRDLRVQRLWFTGKKGKKYLALLIESNFEGACEAGSPDLAYALAVFRFYAIRENTVSGGAQSKPKISYKFSLIDAVDPKNDERVDLGSDLPLVEKSPREQTFWIVNYHHQDETTYKNYSSIEIGDGRLGVFIDDLPELWESSECRWWREDELKIVPQKNLSKSYLPYEFHFTTVRWHEEECYKDATPLGMYETRKFLAHWVKEANNARVLQFEFVGTDSGDLDSSVKPRLRRYVEPLGIAECDEYLEKYQACLRKLVPKNSLAVLESSMEMARESWKKAASNQQSRDTLASACKQALEAAKQTMQSYGCDW